MLHFVCTILLVVQYVYVAGVVYGPSPGPYLSAYRIGSNAPVLDHTIHGRLHHQAVSAAVDRDGNLYVVDRDVDIGEQRNTLDVYPPGSASARYQIRASGEIEGVAVDDANIYVAATGQRDVGSSEPINSCWKIEVYDRKSRTLQRRIRDGVECPGDIAVGINGHLYVRNLGKLEIVEYPAGASTPSRTILTPRASGTVLPDALGNIYALNLGHVISTIIRYGATTADTTIKFTDGLVRPTAIALSGSILYVRDSKGVMPSDAISAWERIPPFGELIAYDGSTGRRLSSIPVQNRIWYYQGPMVSTLACDAAGRVYVMQQGNVKAQSGDGAIEVYYTTANKIEREYVVPVNGTPAFILIGPRGSADWVADS